MLGKGDNVLQIDLICLHLTSERARERAESICRLKELVHSREQVVTLTSEDCNRAVKAFFRMLAIEVKYVKGGPSTTTESKLRHLLRDARTILTIFMSITSLVDSLNDIMEIVLKMLQLPSLLNLYPDIFPVFNCILGGRKHQKDIHSGHMKTLLNLIIKDPNPIDIERSKCIVSMAKYYYESNEVKVMREIISFTINAIDPRVCDIQDPTIIANFLRSLSVCMEGLSETWPISSRSYLDKVLRILKDQNLIKKTIIVDELLRLFDITWMSNCVDQSLVIKVSDFLCQDFVWTRHKLESCSPIDLITERSLTTVLLSALSKYCSINLKDFRSSPRNALDLHIVIFFAHCLHGRTIDRVGLEWAKEMFETAPLLTQRWLLVSFSLLNDSKTFDLFASFALDAIGRSSVSDACIYFLLQRNSFIPNLYDKLSHLSLNQLCVELIRSNFMSRYSEILWSKSAKRCYAEGLNLIVKSLEQQDPKQLPSRLYSLLPSIVTFMTLPLDCDPNYKETAIGFINSLVNIVESIGSSSLQSFLCSKWHEPRITSLQADACYRLMLTSLMCHIRGENYLELDKIYETLGILPQPYHLFQWVLPMLFCIVKTCATFHNLHLLNLLSMLIKCTCTADPMDINDFSMRQENPTTIMMRTIVGINRLLCGLLDLKVDNELLSIKSDCFNFVLERIKSINMDSAELLTLFSNISDIPADSLSSLCELLDHLHETTDAETTIKICSYVAGIVAEENGELTTALTAIFNSYNVINMPLAARKEFLKLAVYLGKQPKHILKEETNVKILEEALILYPSIRWEATEEDIKEFEQIPSYLFRLRQLSQTNQELLIRFTKALQKCHLTNNFGEIFSEISTILPTEQHRRIAYRYLQHFDLVYQEMDTVLDINNNGDESFVCMWNFYQQYLESIHVRHYFAPRLVNALINHYNGEQEKSLQEIRKLKDQLGQVTFSMLFKTNFLQLVALVFLQVDAFGIAEKVEKVEKLLVQFNCIQERSALGELLVKCKTLSSYWVTVVEHNVCLYSIPIEIATSIAAIIPTLPIKLAINSIKKIVEFVNIVNIKDLPKSLKFAYISKEQRSLLKSLDEPYEISGNFLSSMLDLCIGTVFHQSKVFLNHQAIADCLAKWIIAQALSCNQVEVINIIVRSAEKLNDNLFKSIAEAMKYCNKYGMTFDLGKLKCIPWTNWLNSPYEKLYLLEQAGITDHRLYETLYGALSDSDYLDYFRSLSHKVTLEDDHMSMSKWHKVQEEIDNSLLLNQKWDTDDIPTTFDCKVRDDYTFLQLRNCYFEASLPLTVINQVDDVSVKLGLMSIMRKRNELKIEHYANESLNAWLNIKPDADPAKKLRIIRSLESSARNHPSLELDLVSKFATSDFLWKSGALDKALRVIFQASDMVKTNQTSIPTGLATHIFLKAAKWAWKTRSKTAEEINRQFLDCLSLEKLPLNLNSKTYYTLAKFCDDQFERLRSSESLKSRRKLVLRAQKELDLIDHFLERAAPKDPNNYDKSRCQIVNQLCQDTAEIERILREREGYALKAATNYLKALATGDKYDLTVSRLCSLWFSYRKSSTMNNLIANNLLPLHKFVPLMYQIASRAESLEEVDPFQETLQNLLLKTLVAHPHHVVYQLLSLRAAGTTSSIGLKRKLVSLGNSQERRSMAAAQILARAKSTSDTLQRAIEDTERLWQTYVELATVELPTDTAPKTTYPFDTKWQITRIRDLACPIPTTSMLVSPSGHYPDLVTVKGFDNGFSVVGGINLPKIIDCIGSDGRKYRQLVKGRDDDAVMEQVFLMVNRILKQNSKTSHLKLRTFKVIPLKPLAGVLEWVCDAIPIGDYLAAAHERLNPDDLGPKEARALMKKEFERSESTPISKATTYKTEICSKFHPVFRNFFLETTAVCSEWYEKRKQYILSAAVASMVGYVVGLGDRHCQNIMIDLRSGELIHIDLNMIFDLGRTLRIPELVPFRLTRDIVDGMGVMGLEPRFIVNAVKSIAVLRDRMDLMLLIMEAFKYDPLYRWSARSPKTEEWQPPANTVTSTVHTNILDEDDEGEGHKEAERALLRVKEKLLGLEDGTTLSEKGQVSYLISMAMNEDLLAQMYPGWQSWM